MGAEWFPAITRCFSSKSMKMEVASATKNRKQRAKRAWEEEMREVFGHLDSDSDGKISASELREYFGSVGEHMCDAVAQGVIDELDSDGDGMLGFQDFLELIGTGSPDAEGELIMKKAFEMFEHDKGSGRITPRGLQRMLARLGHSSSYHQCAAMIHNYDIDGDGQLDFQEFYHMMT